MPADALTPQARAGALALLEEVFLRTRGRDGTLPGRYPALLAPDAGTRILAAGDADAPDAALLVRPFRLHDAETSHEGAMVGFVCTRPSRRGRGIASALLGRAVDEARALGASFCVLWTQLQDFYARLGWRLGDAGMLGELPGAAHAARAAAPEADAGRIEALAIRAGGPRVARPTAWYRTCPVTAERVERRVAAGGDAYAIVGCAGAERYVYEIAGAPASVAALLEDARAGAARVLVNAGARSAAYAQLSRDARIRWQAQRLAMWMPLAAGYEDVAARGWVVPFFDRI